MKKKLLILLLLVPVLGISQVKVNVKSYLNLRSEPNTNCRVIGKLTNSSEVYYAGEWIEGFIKVKH